MGLSKSAKKKKKKKNEKKRSKRNDTNNNVGINVSAADAVRSLPFMSMCVWLWYVLVDVAAAAVIVVIDFISFHSFLFIRCVVVAIFNQFPSVFASMLAVVLVKFMRMIGGVVRLIVFWFNANWPGPLQYTHTHTRKDVLYLYFWPLSNTKQQDTKGYAETDDKPKRTKPKEKYESAASKPLCKRFIIFNQTPKWITISVEFETLFRWWARKKETG